MPNIIDDKLTIKPSIGGVTIKPVEGTSSFSPDTSSIIVARYEGGEVAEVGGKMKITFKCQTYEKDAWGVTKDPSVQFFDSNVNAQLGLTDCTITKTPVWVTKIGYCTELTIEGFLEE